MIILRQGDHLPTVAVIQSYLNQQPGMDDFVEVDGLFGPRTREGVQRFQRANGMEPTGEVQWEEWRGLVGIDWQIIDSIDRSDHDQPGHEINDHLDVGPYDQTILQWFGLSRGTPLVISAVGERARRGEVILLRFHGHGSPGHMVVASGRISAASSFDYRYPPQFYDALRELRPIFAPFGSVEMHGCRVGMGAPGQRLLRGMADALGVPVTGAIPRQQGGGRTTFRYEGTHTRTVCPGGMHLPVWARSTLTRSVRAARGPR